MLVDYLEERRTGFRAPGWNPLEVRFMEEAIPSMTVNTEGHRLTLTVSTDFHAPQFNYHAARDAAERKLVAFIYKDARAHLEAIVSAVEGQNQREALEACAALRKELGS